MTDVLPSLSFADNPALQPTLSHAIDEQDRTFLWEVLLECVQRQETFVVRCPFCLRRCKKLCLCTSSLLDRTRVAVHKQSFLHLLRQNGRLVSKVYSTTVFGIGELVISPDKETAEQIMANCRYII